MTVPSLVETVKSGNFTVADAEDLATVLKAGKLSC
jgi:preprotein translocase subunit SecD